MWTLCSISPVLRFGVPLPVGLAELDLHGHTVSGASIKVTVAEGDATKVKASLNGLNPQPPIYSGAFLASRASTGALSTTAPTYQPH